MSLMRCHKHDVTWDSDIAAECPRCEEVMLDHRLDMAEQELRDSFDRRYRRDK